MKTPIPALFFLIALPIAAQSTETTVAERLGSVSFPVSCSPTVREPFDRGVALLHDFWYEEAQSQFERIVKADSACAMAHWGIAMSVFHQIWDRPDEHASARAWKELRSAQSLRPKTARERVYVSALREFFRPSKRDFQSRIETYSAAMSGMFQRYPQDVDAGAFYALSLLAAVAPTDTSLANERKAMTVLKPLFTRFPDHPGVVHYIIHACDTPALAEEGLAAARHYGDIAASAPHAVHMPGHIFSRLGMWQADIDSNRASVAASHTAEQRHMSGAMDQFHSDDFLLYAYLQSAQDEPAKALLGETSSLLAHFEAMPGMGDDYMVGMFPYYRNKYPVFYNLEMRDWKSASALEAASGAPPETQTLVYWAKAIAFGHLRQAQHAREALDGYRSLMDQVKKGRHAYYAESIGAQIELDQMLGWIAFAEGNAPEALTRMRAAADLQDKVGQGEVDIPAREMLGDMLLELGQPAQALPEYDRALKLSPNRFNGLFNAGRAAEAAGDEARARGYYAALLKSTDDGARSARPELQHAKAFVAAAGGA
jgi:tetratricopeptide (TPR) repeat protein